MFKWRGNHLTTFTASSPHDPNTRVMMRFREPSEWDFDDLARFLARGILFTKTIDTMTIRVDGHDVFCITKSTAAARPVKAPRLQADWGGAGAPMFQPTRVTSTPMRVEVHEAWHCVPWHNTGGRQTGKDIHTTVHCRVVEAAATVKADKAFRSHTLRVLKKELPDTARVQLLYPGPKESATWAAARSGDRTAAPRGVARSAAASCGGWASHILPVDLTTGAATGLVFVGLATHQTTGAAMHLHSQLIPTIERENIDFQDPQLRRWNMGLLSIAGVAARAMYDFTMAASRAETVASLAAHSFTTSHPSAHVSQAMGDAFFRAPQAAPVVPTTLGLVPASEALLPVHRLELVLEALDQRGAQGAATLAVVRSSAMAAAPPFFQALREAGVGVVMGLDDVSTLLKAYNVRREDLLQVLRWFCDHSASLAASNTGAGAGAGAGAGSRGVARRGKSSSRTAPAQAVRSLLSLVSWLDADGTAQSMRRVKYFDPDAGSTPGVAATLPSSCLPSNVSTALTHEQLRGLGLKPLPLKQWLVAVLARPARLTTSRAHARAVLAALSRRSGAFSDADWRKVVSTLGQRECVPTTDGGGHKGMRLPQEVFVPSDAIPGDLPVLDMRVVGSSTMPGDGLSAGTADVADVADVDVDVSMDSDSDGDGPVSPFITRHFAVRLGVRTVPGMSVLLGTIKSQPSSGCHDNRTVVAHILDARRAAGGWTSEYADELRHSAFLRAGSGARGGVGGTKDLHVPSQLYFASAIREAAAEGMPAAALHGLKVVQWGPGDADLSPHSEAGTLLKELGVRERVALDTVLAWCSGVSQDGRQLDGDERRCAWLFLLRRFKHYRSDYAPDAATPAFVPCTFGGEDGDSSDSRPTPGKRSRLSSQHGKGKSKSKSKSKSKGQDTGAGHVVWCKPAECFATANPLFPSLSPVALADLKAHGVHPVTDLRLQSHPTLDSCIDALLAAPTLARAREVFTYLGSGYAMLPPGQMKKLKSRAFIPVATDSPASAGGASPQLVLAKPCDVYVVPSKGDEVVAVGSDHDDVSAPATRRGKRTRSGASRSRRRRVAPPVAAAADTHQGGMSPPRLYAGLASFVDFGEAGNAFLRRCGVRGRPSPTELAQMLIAHAGAYRGSWQRYAKLLSELAQGVGRINKAVLRELRRAPVLLAFTLKADGRGDGSGGNKAGGRARASSPGDNGGNSRGHSGGSVAASDVAKEGHRVAVVGVPPADVYLSDDLALERLLQPHVLPAAPRGTLLHPLQKLYVQLGCTWLSEAAKTSSQPVGAPKATQRAARVQATIQARMPLVLLTPRGDAVEGVNTKAARLLRDVEVVEVAAIVRTVTFNGAQIQTDAAVAPTCAIKQAARSTTLYLAPAGATTTVLGGGSDGGNDGSAGAVDWYDVADAMVKLLFPTQQAMQQQHAGYVFMVMSSTPSALRRRGLDVDSLSVPASGEVDIDVADAAAATHRDVPSRVSDNGHGGRSTNVQLGGTVADFVDTERDMQRAMSSALRGCRRSKLQRIVTAQERRERVDHQCEDVAASDLRESGTRGGLPLYVEAGQAVDELPPGGADEFAALLTRIASVLGVSKSALHLYYDTATARIAYNSGGSLFFNLRYYLQCHRPVCVTGVPTRNRSRGKAKGRKSKPAARSPQDVVSFWFVTMCHELAHNVEGGHNALHENAMESLIARFAIAVARSSPDIAAAVWSKDCSDGVSDDDDVVVVY